MREPQHGAGLSLETDTENNILIDGTVHFNQLNSSKTMMKIFIISSVNPLKQILNDSVCWGVGWKQKELHIFTSPKVNYFTSHRLELNLCYLLSKYLNYSNYYKTLYVGTQVKCNAQSILL